MPGARFLAATCSVLLLLAWVCAPTARPVERRTGRPPVSFLVAADASPMRVGSGVGTALDDDCADLAATVAPASVVSHRYDAGTHERAVTPVPATAWSRGAVDGRRPSPAPESLGLAIAAQSVLRN
jgi:hypothetical protein